MATKAEVEYLENELEQMKKFNDRMAKSLSFHMDRNVELEKQIHKLEKELNGTSH